MTENLPWYIKCPTEDNENRHDGRSLQLTLTSPKLRKMTRSDQSHCGFEISTKCLTTISSRSLTPQSSKMSKRLK